MIDRRRRPPGPTLLATVLVALAAQPTAERLPVRTLTTADGLPRDQLACVRSDRLGFVWFCTAEGLVRFDGRAAVTFGQSEGLDPPGVRSFLPARDGRYWVGADAKLFEFRPAPRDGTTRFRVVPRDDGRRTGGVNALAESRDGSIWAATGYGLLRLSHTSGRAHLREVEIGLPRTVDNDRIVRAVVEDVDGALWAGAISGLYARRPDGSSWRVTTQQGLPTNEVRALALDIHGRLWVGTREGLCLIDRAAVFGGRGNPVVRTYTARDGLPAPIIASIYPQGDALWIGTVAGIVEVSLTDRGDLRAGRQLAGLFGWDIAGDAHGDVWIATEAGARKLATRGFTTYAAADGLPTARVASLFETRAGEVCATTNEDRLALSCFDGRRFVPVPLGGLPALRDPGWGWSQLALQDHQGRWWIPTGEGLFQFAAGAVSTLASGRPVATYGTARGLRSNSVFRLFEDSRGGMWLATFADDANGLARVDPRTGALSVFGGAEGVPADLQIVYGFAEDRSGSIWVGLETSDLLRYRAGRFERIPLHQPNPVDPTARPTYDHLRSLVVDRRGRLWIASTVSGVGRIDDPTAESPVVRWYGRAEGLSSDTVWMLVESPSGDLFIGTGRGVDRFSPESGRFVHYSADEGVPRGEILGGLRDRTGHIWFATTDGAARLESGDEPTPLPPSTLITAVRIGGVPRPVPADGAMRIDRLTVQPGDRRIEIDYVSPGARNVAGITYQHQLEGVDASWTTTEARTVALAGAAPGRYVFLVRGVLASGEAGPPARVEFTVLAPVWRRWWFLASVAGLGVVLAAAAHRARVRRLVEVERVRSRIAADLHDGVGASLSRIAILSEVVRQRAAVALPDALPALASIGDNARGLVDDISDAIWSIDPGLDTLQELIVRARATAADLFEPAGIAWTLEAPVDAARVSLTPEQRRHLYLILKESLTNIVRHACASRVTVRVGVSHGVLLVHVEDDGVGVESAPRASNTGGHGLENMRARTAALGGALSVTRGPDGRGTRLTLSAPV